MKRVCLDNNILIWGVRSKASKGQEDCINRAVSLFGELDEMGARIIIPTPVLAEFLTYSPVHRHAEITASLERHFQLTPFDGYAATVAARLWRELAEKPRTWHDELHAEVPGITRARIKYDIQILATAMARHTDILYTHDKGLTKLAKGRIDVRQLPSLPPKQEDLFKEQN